MVIQKRLEETSRSAKGLPDNSKWLIIGGIIVAIVAISVLSGN